MNPLIAIRDRNEDWSQNEIRSAGSTRWYPSRWQRTSLEVVLYCAQCTSTARWYFSSMCNRRQSYQMYVPTLKVQFPPCAGDCQRFKRSFCRAETKILSLSTTMDVATQGRHPIRRSSLWFQEVAGLRPRRWLDPYFQGSRASNRIHDCLFLGIYWAAGHIFTYLLLPSRVLPVG